MPATERTRPGSPGIRLALWIALAGSYGCHGPDDPTLFVLPGAFSQQTTAADLEARFGKANVTTATEPEFEGAPLGLVLFSDDPSRRAYVRFHDAEQTSLASIAVRDPASRWRGKQGVHVGMTFAALRKVNGKPFGYSGFDAEGRGWAHDQWSIALDADDGTLGTLDVAEDEHMYFGVDLRVRDDAPADAYPHEQGAFESDDPQYPRLGALVVVSGFNATTSLDDESD
jgi:hypothetical protein